MSSALRDAWLAGPEGRLCGREQAKAWALREIWRADGKSAYGMLAFVAARVRKTEHGKPGREAPTAEAMKEFFHKLDMDPEWYPGKHSGQKRGRKRVLRGAKRGAVVSAAKRLKTEGQEPTYAAIVAACPRATQNPATKEPVDKRSVYTVFREACYDDCPENKWSHMNRLSRSALTDNVKQKREEFATYMLNLGRSPAWYKNNLVWCDLCSSILPRTMKKAQEMTMARKSGKAWMSKGSQQQSHNLRLPKSVLKVNSSDSLRVWWVPVLTRGKLHIDLLPDNFPGETPEGAAMMVAKVRAALNRRFHATSPPKILFTDRGNGFYFSGTGKITDGYQRALRAHKLKAFFPKDASIQPGTLQEVMLHETAVAWMRTRLAQTVPKKAWEESVDAYGSRLKTCAAFINSHYNVKNLCRELPQRLHALQDSGGDRLAK